MNIENAKGLIMNNTQISLGEYLVKFNSDSKTFEVVFSNGTLKDIIFNGIENCKVKYLKTKNGKQLTAKNDSQRVKFCDILDILLYRATRD